MTIGNRPSHEGWSLFTVIALATTILAVAGAYYVPKLVPTTLVEQVLKFSAVGVGLVWTLSYQFFQKLTEVTETAGIDYREHGRLEQIVRYRVRRFWLGTGLLLICGITLTLPSLLTSSEIAVPCALWRLGILALGGCVILLARTIKMNEELRSFRSAVKENERREKARAEQLAELGKIIGDGKWEKDARLDGFRGD